MLGHVLFVFRDVFGIVCGCFGCGLGALVLIVSPTNILSNLNQFFIQLTALLGTLGCLVASGSIVMQNISKSRKQFREDIGLNRSEIDALKVQAAADREVAAKAMAETERVRAEAARDKKELEDRLRRLHETTKKNAAVVSTLKLESDFRKSSTPDPDQPVRVEIVNKIDHPVPTVTQPSETTHPGADDA